MQILWLFSIFGLAQTLGGWDPNKRPFPPTFHFGVTTSAYQVEGAWNEDGKGESILDRFYHSNPGAVADSQTGDVASDSYHLVDRDIEMMRELGIDFYRFSVSWSRILPSGFSNVINEKALQYYEYLLEELYKYNIEAMVTLYYYDLPQPLQDLGGWTNPLIVQWFQDYATIVFKRFTKRVQHWVTINNPAICFDMYRGKMPPAILSQGIGDYICARHMLLAHANAYRWFDEEIRQKGGRGQVGISLGINWADPLDFNKTQQDASELYRNFSFGMFLDPIFGKKGDYPKLVKDTVAKKSKEQGYRTSRLPVFTPEEIKLVHNSSDFLGINHYTTHFVRFSNKKLDVGKPAIPHPYVDIDVVLSHGKDWTKSKSPWLTAAPYGLYKLCDYLTQNYHQTPIIVTEHGWSTDVGIEDTGRINVMFEYLKAVLVSLQDDCDIRGLTVWSLMDNFQWEGGFTERFGLYEVDFADPEKKRSHRYSALFLRNVIDTRKLTEHWKPKSLSLNVTDRRLLKREKMRDEL